MKKIAKRLLCGILAAVLVSGTVAVTPAHAENAQEEGAAQTAMDVWVQNSADRAFASSTMPDQATQKIELYAARNEYTPSLRLVAKNVTASYVTQSILQSHTSRICRRCSSSATKFAKELESAQPLLLPKLWIALQRISGRTEIGKHCINTGSKNRRLPKN